MLIYFCKFEIYKIFSIKCMRKKRENKALSDTERMKLNSRLKFSKILYK